MSQTKIEWAHSVWNPITGCTPISEGCTNCWAKRMAQRLKGRFGYPQEDPFKVTFHPDRLNQPMKWKKPRMIFCCSMGDLFHENVRDYTGQNMPSWEVVWDVFHHMNKAPWHTYLLLTKRPENALNFWKSWVKNSDQLSHIWLGVTAENQKRADERIPILLKIPAAKRFVSIEPMLAPIYSLPLYLTNKYEIHPDCKGSLDWVIVGGETGPGARPLHPDWVRSIRDQCHRAGVPFFMKQMSKKESIPDDLMIREYPKCQ